MKLEDVPAVRRSLRRPEIVARAKVLEIQPAELARRILTGEHADILPLGSRLRIEFNKDRGLPWNKGVWSPQRQRLEANLVASGVIPHEGWE